VLLVSGSRIRYLSVAVPGSAWVIASVLIEYPLLCTRCSRRLPTRHSIRRAQAVLRCSHLVRNIDPGIRIPREDARLVRVHEAPSARGRHMATARRAPPVATAVTPGIRIPKQVSLQCSSSPKRLLRTHHKWKQRVKTASPGRFRGPQHPPHASIT